MTNKDDLRKASSKAERLNMIMTFKPEAKTGWRTVADLPYSEKELVEICHRYNDIKLREQVYRQKKAAKITLMKERLAQFESEEEE